MITRMVSVLTLMTITQSCTLGGEKDSECLESYEDEDSYCYIAGNVS